LRKFALGAVLVGLGCLSTSPTLAEPGVFESFGAHTLPSATTIVGPSAAGFALSLTADSPRVAFGSPLLVTVELRPVSGDNANVLYGSRHSSYLFTITDDSDGAIIPSVENTFGLDPLSGPWCGRPVAQGKSIFGRFQLDQMYALRKPGTYSIVAVGTPMIGCKPVTLRSNTIKITLDP
jgi:hypothetical protein